MNRSAVERSEDESNDDRRRSKGGFVGDMVIRRCNVAGKSSVGRAKSAMDDLERAPARRSGGFLAPRSSRLGERRPSSLARLMAAGTRRLSEDTDRSVESWNGVLDGLVGDSKVVDMICGVNVMK